jgi:hypothetical protein
VDGGPFRERDLASEFWQFVAEHTDRKLQFEEGKTGRLEQLVLRRFGIRLRDTLLAEFGGLGRDRHPEFVVGVERRHPAFAFQAVGLRYGSLALDLDVAGVKSLVEFFDGNIEVFQVALAQYGPTSLGGSVTDYYRQEVTDLECSATPSAELVSAFSSASAPSSSPQGAGSGVRSKLEAVNWAWILANTSLVVPVLLCIFVWYVTTQGIEKDREQLRQMITSLAERQNEVIKLLVTEHEANLAKSEKTPAIQTPASSTASSTKATKNP